MHYVVHLLLPTGKLPGTYLDEFIVKFVHLPGKNCVVNRLTYFGKMYADSYIMLKLHTYTIMLQAVSTVCSKILYEVIVNTFFFNKWPMDALYG